MLCELLVLPCPVTLCLEPEHHVAAIRHASVLSKAVEQETQ